MNNFIDSSSLQYTRVRRNGVLQWVVLVAKAYGNRARRASRRWLRVLSRCRWRYVCYLGVSDDTQWLVRRAMVQLTLVTTK